MTTKKCGSAERLLQSIIIKPGQYGDGGAGSQAAEGRRRGKIIILPVFAIPHAANSSTISRSSHHNAAAAAVTAAAAAAATLPHLSLAHKSDDGPKRLGHVRVVLHNVV